jgi:hypothetical protein
MISTIRLHFVEKAEECDATMLNSSTRLSFKKAFTPNRSVLVFYFQSIEDTLSGGKNIEL